jgi:hypothetical protein
VKPISSARLENTASMTRSGRTWVSNSGHRSASASSGAVPYSAVAYSSNATGRPNSTIRYQRSPTRQRRQRPARSRTPSRPRTAAVMTNAGTAEPRMWASQSYGACANGTRSRRFSTGDNASATLTANTMVRHAATG